MASIGTPRDALIIIAAALAATIFFGRPIVRAWRGRAWPHAHGTVTSAAIEEKSRSSVASYFVTVKYRYDVDGTTHAGERVSFAERAIRYRLRALASAELGRFATGTTVDVRYNPRDPADAVIDPRIPWRWAIALCISTTFLALGLIGLLRGLAA